MSYAHYKEEDLLVTLSKLEKGQYVTPWERANFETLIARKIITNENLKERIEKYLNAKKD
ncbi:hypothetical protein SRABI13_00462 [Erwinia aphidicola]|uniref:hypothetical protein n=1 Tax=Erwinia aphidicola TaxID=68334 RepID=UPI001DCD44B7|nr:hypothetical protein [Erwinia aphidicola]CAH0148375.1 hypothetical protein SRABI13_00462 [Erwinia aphidicola]